MYVPTLSFGDERASQNHTVDTKYQRAGCRWSQLIESYLKALIANRLAAKKHFGNEMKS